MNKEFFRDLNPHRDLINDEHQERLEQRTEFIQRPPKDLLLKDGWFVDIDQNVNGKVESFIRVTGRDKFDVLAKANAIYELIENGLKL